MNERGPAAWVLPKFPLAHSAKNSNLGAPICISILARESLPRPALEKAEAHAAAKKIDSSVLLNSLLSPDMFARARQVQIASDQAKNGSARLAGVKHPAMKIMRRRSISSKRGLQKRSPI